MNTNNIKTGSTFEYGNEPQIVTKVTAEGVVKFKNAAGHKCELSVMQFEANYYGFITNIKF